MTVQIQPVARDHSRTAAKFGRLKAAFRGSYTDYCRSVKLGSGYIGKWRLTNLCRNCRAEYLARGGHPWPEFSKPPIRCHHFEIDTARQLAGPLRAIEDPNVRVMMLLKAAQTAGSLTWDMAVHALLVLSHYMRIMVLMDSDEKAKAYCNRRLMDTLKANPDIAPLLPTGAERFGVSDTEIRLLNGKVIFVGGLNDRNASSLPADVMILDEGWLAQSNGLLKKAFGRLKQQAGGKIILVSQAGDVDEDQDGIWKSLHKRVPLTWACPCCGGRQEFQLSEHRPQDFTPKPPLAAWQAEVSQWKRMHGEMISPEFYLPEPPAPGTHYGYKLPKKISELTTAEEIKAACAQTTYECRDCGYQIADTWEMRQRLHATYEQDYQETDQFGNKFTPENYTVGFWNPDPASVFVPFAETMEDYVDAVKAKENFGTYTKLQIFYTQRWARAWNINQHGRNSALTFVPSSYETDPGQLSYGAETHCRQMTVDCGKAPWAGPEEHVIGKLFFEVRDIHKHGHSRQMARGLVEDLDGQPGSAWALLAAQQRYWKIPAARVFVDSAWMPSQVEEAAVKHFELVKPRGGTVEQPSCWRMVAGSDYKRISVNSKRADYIFARIPNLKSAHDGHGKLWRMYLWRLTWGNYHFEQQFESIRTKSVSIEWEILPLEKLVIVGLDGQPSKELTEKYLAYERDLPNHWQSWESQLSSRYEDPKIKTFKDYDKKSRPTEARDLGLMHLAAAALDGLLGHVDTGE